MVYAEYRRAGDDAQAKRFVGRSQVECRFPSESTLLGLPELLPEATVPFDRLDVFKPIANAFGLAEERLNPARRIRSWPMETDRRPAREWGGLWVVFELVLAVLYVTGSHTHLGIAAVYAAGAAAVLIAVIVGRGYMTVLLFAGGLQYVVFGVAGFLLWHERVRGVIALVGGTLVLAAAFARWRRRPTL